MSILRIPNNVLQFAGAVENTGIYKMFADYYKHFRALNGETGLEFQKTTVNENGQTVELSFSEKEEKMNAAMKKEILRIAGINDLAGFPVETWAGHPTLRWAAFAVVSAMVDMIMPDSMFKAFGMFAEIRNVGFGDSASFDVKPRDLFAVSKVGRGKRTSELHKQYNGQVTLTPEPRQLSVSVNFYRVLAGKESLADFVTKVVQSMETEFSYDMYAAFSTAMDALDNTAATGLRVAGYTQPEFVRLAQTVSAWNGGQRAIAVGTQVALASILPSNTNYRYDIDSEFVKVGYVKEFQGVSVMALPQIADWTTPFSLKLSDKRIWFLSPSSQKLIKAVVEGTTLSRSDDANDNANLTSSSTLNKSWATAVVTNAVAGTMVLP